VYLNTRLRRYSTRAYHAPTVTVDKNSAKFSPTAIPQTAWTSTYDLAPGAPMPNPAISGVKERDQAVHEPPHLYIGGLAGRRDLASNNLIGNKCIPVFLDKHISIITKGITKE
jgi:hypothetical protein